MAAMAMCSFTSARCGPPDCPTRRKSPEILIKHFIKQNMTLRKTLQTLNQRVAGPNPAAPTNLKKNLVEIGEDVSNVDSILAALQLLYLS